MVQRAIVIILIVAIAAIGAYDAWRYTTTQQQLRDTTYDLARWAAENAQRLTRDQAAAELAAMGERSGVTVYQYGQTEQGIQIWTETPVTDTIIASTLINLASGMPFSEATSADFVIRDYREAGI